MMTPFSGSIRSLATDSSRRIMIWLVVTGLILVAWVGWFFKAEITVYETASQVYLEQSTPKTTSGKPLAQDFTVVANFNQTSLSRLGLGQEALLHLASFKNTAYQDLKAVITELGPVNQNGLFRVELKLVSLPDPAPRLQTGLAGTLEVETAQLSPAMLVWQAINHHDL